jgi:4-hydroxy-tetrahydrodipicolinate reductase
MHRILHVGVGPLGQRIIAELVDRKLGRIIAAVDPAPEFRARDLHSVVPTADPGVSILPSLDAVTNWDQIDAVVVTTSSDLGACASTFRSILAKGKPLVSTCEELVYPWLRHLGLAEELDMLAKAGGGRLLGTGVNPGFLMDTLPVVLTGVCRKVAAVRCSRIQDASSRRVPFQKKIGAGLDDDTFARRVADGSLRHVGLGESLHFIAHYTGVKIERWDEDIRPVHATRDLVCALGPIPKGKVSGVRQTARGYADERVAVSLEFQAAIGQEDPHDRVVVEGEPPLDVILHGGVHGDLATSAIVCNAIPKIIAAKPGLHTMATVPPVAHIG